MRWKRSEPTKHPVLCVRQFTTEQPRDDIFAGTPETFSMRYLISRQASKKLWRILILDIRVAFMHARTDEDIHVKKNKNRHQVESLLAVEGCNQ